MDFLPFDIIRCIAMDLATTAKLRQLNRKFNYIVSSNWLHYKQSTPFTHTELVSCILERLRTKQKIQLSYVSKACWSVYFKLIKDVLYIRDPKTTKNNYHRVYINTRKYLNKWCKKRSNARPPLTSVLTTLEKRNIARTHVAKLAMQEIARSIEILGVPMWVWVNDDIEPPPRLYVRSMALDNAIEGFLASRIKDISCEKLLNNFSPMHLRELLTKYDNYVEWDNIVYIKYICKIYEIGYIPRAVVLTDGQIKQIKLEMVEENRLGFLGMRNPDTYLRT